MEMSCAAWKLSAGVDALDPASMSGTVLAVPVVNVHGYNTGDRYLPDRRDLYSSFPGSTRGSLAARIAHLLMTEVVSRSSVGLDLHTGSDHRTNLPQALGTAANGKRSRVVSVRQPKTTMNEENGQEA